MPDAFRLGDFTFIVPGTRAALDRRNMRPQRPLLGADPPVWLDGLVREAVEQGPAELLWDGDFRGHGEPAYSVFDVIVEGSHLLDVCLLQNAEGESTLTVRPANSSGRWHVLYKTSWFRTATQPAGSETLAPELCSPMAGPTDRTEMRMAIGFEYPIECTSRNDVSWVAVAIQEDGVAESVYLIDEELS